MVLISAKGKQVLSCIRGYLAFTAKEAVGEMIAI